MIVLDLAIQAVPMLRLATVLAKIEGCNPSLSVKSRIAAGMIWDAEERGELKPGVGESALR